MENQQSLFGRPIFSISDAICVIELGEGGEGEGQGRAHGRRDDFPEREIPTDKSVNI